MEVVKNETVWADEENRTVRFEADQRGRMRVIILQSGEECSSATISNWRWKRIAKKFCVVESEENEGDGM